MSASQDASPRRGLLPRFTLKDGDTFLLADALGDIHDREDGLFADDTRILSRFELSIADRPGSLLGAAVSQDNTTFIAHLTNLPLPTLGERSIPKGVIHIERRRILACGRLNERLTFTNFSERRAELPIRFVFSADYADIFEVQGHVRPARGQILKAEIVRHGVRLAYRGLDTLVRNTAIEFSLEPTGLSAESADFLIQLESGAAAELYVEIGPIHDAQAPLEKRYEEARKIRTETAEQLLRTGGHLHTSGRLFNQWVEKSRADLALLTTPLRTGPYPYAGIPWFSTQFGRDAIITALQTLWLEPHLAAGVLRYLASTQATQTSSFRDSEPGKIMHETRRGEMANLREIPFGRYYGGVDTTPLFVMLAGAYAERTDDRALINEIWPNLMAAMGWIETRIERSATGFLDYARAEDSGLANQAWKDSQDSIFHADGRLPRGPIAVVEVQGYAYAAFLAMAQLAAMRQDPQSSDRWLRRAADLRSAIEEKFWIPSLSFYALAIDGDGTPCRVRASNAGHLLYCGVPTLQRGKELCSQLLCEGFCSGWGIRTLLEDEARYNPMSYHNGSIWPHDTAICAAGIAKYGGRAEAVKIAGDLFEAANQFSMRLPELFCGFSRDTTQSPVPYPVACLPQAWASGSIFMLLQAILGIRIDGATKEVHIERPLLPEGIDSLRVCELPVGDARIDLEFHRLGAEVGAVPSRHLEGGVKVLAHL
ncbi:MAG TPA: amylo-alpha-1,6-glucosidase [Steroidobacteraceae bacterium]